MHVVRPPCSTHVKDLSFVILLSHCRYQPSRCRYQRHVVTTALCVLTSVSCSGGSTRTMGKCYRGHQGEGWPARTGGYGVCGEDGSDWCGGEKLGRSEQPCRETRGRDGAREDAPSERPTVIEPAERSTQRFIPFLSELLLGRDPSGRKGTVYEINAASVSCTVD